MYIMNEGVRRTKIGIVAVLIGKETDAVYV